MTTAKLTPNQRYVLRFLRQEHYSDGWPVEKLHKGTLAGLERRGLAVVMAGRAFPTERTS